MKKVTVVLMSLLLISLTLAACSKSKDTSSDNKKVGNSSVSIDKIKQAAKDAGYVITDDYISFSMDEVTGGFSVELDVDNEDVIYSVMECKTEEIAKKNAKIIDDAGYNIALRNGKILTCIGVDRKNGTARGILESIIKGSPVPAAK